MFGQSLQTAEGTITLADARVGFDLRVAQANGRRAAANGAVLWDPERRALDVASLDVSFGSVPWRLVSSGATPHVAWTDDEIAISPMQFAVSTDTSQRIDVAGT